MPLAASTSCSDLIAHFEKHNKVRTIEAHQSKVHSVAWSCDGRKLASGSIDKTVSVMLLDNYRLPKDSTLRGHTQTVDQLIWHPSSPELLASAGADKSVRVWDVRSKKQVASVTTKGENINVTWSPDGHTIAAGSKEDQITFIDTRNYQTIAVEQFKFEVNEISFNNESTHFFLTNGSGQVVVLTWPDRKELVTLQAHPMAASCVCIKFDATGRYFAVGGTDALVSVWDAYNLVCVRTLTRLDWPVRAVSFSCDGALIASGSEDLVIDVAHAETGAKICDIKSEAATFTIAWHPKEYLLAYACDEKASSGSYSRESGTVRLFGIPATD